jgi:hypothetical protein
MFDRRQTIQQANARVFNIRIPHTKKIIEAMRAGDERVCQLTQDGTSCKCRDAKLSAYADQLRDIDSAIKARLNPMVANLARVQRDRFRKEAEILKEQARQVRAEANLKEQELKIKAEALIEQSTTDAERAANVLWMEGRISEDVKDERAHRIAVEDRTALISYGACGCCLQLIYQQVAAPSYAPREGDQIACHATCGMGTVFVYAGGKWRGWRKG